MIKVIIIIILLGDLFEFSKKIFTNSAAGYIFINETNSVKSQLIK